MIYLTGDTHGDFGRFSIKRFPQQKDMDRNDYVIILGDFGGIFDGSRQEMYWLDWLSDKPFTVLWIDGNHENFDILNDLYPEPWNGGRIRRIRPNILHLCRGQVFRLDEKTFFALGGAQSHDARVLLSQSPSLSQNRRALKRRKVLFRVEGESWWRQELPDQHDLRMALDALAWEDWEVDVVLTHCAPTSLQNRLFPHYPVNILTDFLETARQRLSYGQWFCGHYHQEIHLPDEHFRTLYESIIPLDD